MNNDSSFISEWFYMLLDSIQPFVLEWGKPIALAVLAMIVVLLLLLLALWLQGVGQRRQQRLEVLQRAYPFLKQEESTK